MSHRPYGAVPFLTRLPEPVLVGTRVRITQVQDGGEVVIETCLAPGVAAYLAARHPDAVEILDDDEKE